MLLTGARVSALLLALAGTTTAAFAAGPAPTLLVSMDGFRWDYRDLHPAETVHLRELAATGISAHSLIPVYPSNTFPNHYAIATGLVPAHSGIINNQMFDPVFGEYYYYNRPQYNGDPKWWGGEPIWITAVKQGRPSACSYWVGSETTIGGLRPTYWHIYNYYKVSFEDRLNELIGWLKLPPEKRPAVIAFYFEETNTAGHRFGPDSPETAAAIKLLDGHIGEMQARFKAEGVAVNWVIVSDHGMVKLAPDATAFLDDYISLKDVQVDFDGPVVGLRPLKGNAAALAQSLAKLPHAKAYLTKDLPERFRLKGSVRIPPVWLVVEPGYEVRTRGWINSAKEFTTIADHGYDPQEERMHATLIANGPAFKSDGSVVPDVPNTDIYNLICAVEGLKPAKNDGDDTLVKEFLR